MIEGWEEKTLGDLVDIGSSKRIYYEEYTDNGIPFFRSKEVIEKNKRNSITTELWISDERFKILEEKYGVPNRGEILLTSVGTLGVPWLIDIDTPFYFKDGNLTWFKNFSSNLSNVFLFWWLNCPQGKEKLNNISIGSTQPAITIRGLKSIEIVTPPLTEQKAIAEILSSLDDKIDLLHRQNATLEALAETLFRQTFIEEAQDDWEEVALSQFIKTNTHTLRKGEVEGSIQYLDTGSLTKGRIEELQSFEFAEAPSRARRKAKHNDVLISTVRPNQKHYGLARSPETDLVVSTGFCVIEAHGISPYFVYVFLTSDEMTEYLHMVAEASTSAYPSLKPSDIEKLTFTLPPNEIIEEFHQQCDCFWAELEANQEQIQTLESLRDTLLPKLMSGAVRVEYERPDAMVEAV